MLRDLAVGVQGVRMVEGEGIRIIGIRVGVRMVKGGGFQILGIRVDGFREG
jgi:hypothetical protein